LYDSVIELFGLEERSPAKKDLGVPVDETLENTGWAVLMVWEQP